MASRIRRRGPSQLPQNGDYVLASRPNFDPREQMADSLNAQLSKLLKMQPEEFYKTVSMDESLEVSLTHYLQVKRQYYNSVNEHGKPLDREMNGDAELCRRVFMVFYRLSLIYERGIINTSLVAKYSEIINKRRFFDIAKLLNICAIYGHDNQLLTQQLVTNAFASNKQLQNDLENIVPSLSERIYGMHKQCFLMLMSQQSTSESAVQKFHDELIEVLIILSNAVVSIHAIVDTCPNIAKLLVEESNADNRVFTVFAAMHDSLLSIVQKALLYLQVNMPENQIKHVEAKQCLRRLRYQTMEVVWRLFCISYLSENDVGTVNGVQNSQNFLCNPELRGERFVLASTSMVEASVDFSLREEPTSNGALLRNIEKKFKLLDRVNKLRKKGLIILDGAQYDYVEGIIGHTFAAIGSVTVNGTASTTSQDVEEDILYESKITHIKDILPEYGRGFIAACLEAYDNNPEEVIQRILEGTLHPSLESLDRTSEEKSGALAPTMSLSAKDKGKGKVDETLPNGSRSASSSSFNWLQDANDLNQRQVSSMSTSSSTVYEDGNSSSTPLIEHDKALKGRFMRKVKGEENVTTLLNDHSAEDVLRTVAYVAQYEDEYDDSFDDLNTNIADGIEETEVLVDMANSRMALEGNEQNNRTSRAGRRDAQDSNGNYYQRVIPGSESNNASAEVSKKTHDTAGRGQSRGRGRGRGDEPKGQFFVKDGKNYSYKVAGSVAVASAEEAEALKRAAEETIHGLGRGGNIPFMKDQDTGNKNSSNPSVDANSMHGAISGRGNSPQNRGRGRKGYDPHHKKDRAMNKHFRSVGGL